MTENATIRDEMSQVQKELQDALRELKAEVGQKLKPSERAEIEAEFRQLDIVLERLKTGLVWIALFGKTSVGKSAIANALMEDDIAEVGIDHDLTTKPAPYKKPPWMLVDVPGFMGKQVNERVAVEEARKAHGHLFVIDGEPYADELELFDLVHRELPETPKIVFVNKWDVVTSTMPKSDQQKVRARIEEKMSKYVMSKDDIVYGSAMLYDRAKDAFVRQTLPVLVERMYEEAGTLGMIMNVLDPANRAVELGEKVRKRITDVRLRVARKVVSAFGAASVAGGFIPFNQLIVTPGLLAGMVLTIFHVMGRKIDRKTAKSVAVDLLKTCGLELGAEFTAAVVVESILSGAIVLGPVGALIGMLGSMVGLGVFRYRRTVILGEVTIEYVLNNCTWEGCDRHEVFIRCRDRAMSHYMKLRKQAS